MSHLNGAGPGVPPKAAPRITQAPRWTMNPIRRSRCLQTPISWARRCRSTASSTWLLKRTVSSGWSVSIPTRWSTAIRNSCGRRRWASREFRCRRIRSAAFRAFRWPPRTTSLSSPPTAGRCWASTCNRTASSGTYQVSSGEGAAAPPPDPNMRARIQRAGPTWLRRTRTRSSPRAAGAIRRRSSRAKK